jgi:large subunit ribosomal protein L30
MKKYKITQVRSTINCLTKQKRTMAALGLKGLHQVVVHPNTPTTVGMLNIVRHLVKVEEITE